MGPKAGAVLSSPASLGKSGKHLFRLFIAESATGPVKVDIDRKSVGKLCLELFHTLRKKQNLSLQPALDSLFLKQRFRSENFYVA